IYADDDPRIAAYRPAALAIERDDEKKRWVLALEALDDAVLMNAQQPGAGTDEAIDAALEGPAQVHARWFGDEARLLDQEWLPPLRGAATRIPMKPLWTLLAEP